MTSSDDRGRQASELRRLAEESDQGQKGQSPIKMEAMSLEETQHLLHELRMHQIELEMQNVELGRAQNGLAVERARYFDLYNLAPVGYCTVSEQGLLLEANLHATNLLGLTQATLKGQRISRFIIEADQDIYYLLRKNLFATAEPQNCELRMVKIDGTVFWAALTISLAWDGAGKPVNPMVLRDISERKRAEEALREQRDFSESLIETAQAIILVLDTQGCIVRFNPYMEELAGYALDEVKGMDWFETFLTPGINRTIKTLFQKTVADIRTSGNVNPIIAKDGQTILVEWYNKTLKDKDGSTVGVLAIGQDITERKRLEEEQKKLQAQLQQAQKMEAIGTLAGGIAHDFNNILGAILGYAEMAQEDSPAGSILRQDIDQIVKAGLRARELVKQILAFSRQAETEQIPLQPGVIIREASNLLRSSLPATIAIEQDIDQKAGFVLVDPTQIHQIVMNLCTNAFHAMEESGGILSISLKNKVLSREDLLNMPYMQPGKFVELTVGDTGSGIAPEIRERIFEPYFTTKEVGKGTGMGLAIIYGIAMSYGGSISCQSKPGGGTVFQVYLPVVDDSALLDEQVEGYVQRGSEHILFIDDEAILAEMGKNMLERLGYQVTARKNSIEALTTFQNQPQDFDLVITDQTMPGMTGSDLARRMLQIRPDLPIILCTGYSSLMSKENARSLGIKGFAMKPLAKKDIAALIRTMLDGGDLRP